MIAIFIGFDNNLFSHVVRVVHVVKLNPSKDLSAVEDEILFVFFFFFFFFYKKSTNTTDSVHKCIKSKIPDNFIRGCQIVITDENACKLA